MNFTKQKLSERLTEELNDQEKFFKKMFAEKWDDIPTHIEETFQEIKDEIIGDLQDLEESEQHKMELLEKAEKDTVAKFLPEHYRDLNTVSVLQNIIQNIDKIDIVSLSLIFGE